MKRDRESVLMSAIVPVCLCVLFAVLLATNETGGCNARAQVLMDDDDSAEVLWPLLPLPHGEGEAEIAPYVTGPPAQQQVQALHDAADALLVLDAYLTDKEAVAAGTCPEGFVLLSLDEYKAKKIRLPLALGAKD